MRLLRWYNLGLIAGLEGGALVQVLQGKQQLMDLKEGMVNMCIGQSAVGGKERIVCVRQRCHSHSILAETQGPGGFVK
jgi:hypothetical protein